MRALFALILLLGAAAASAQYVSVSGGGQPGYKTNPVATPTFTPAGGSYSTTQSVTISTSTPSAVICYTADGSTPTESGHVCSGGTTQTYRSAIAVSSSAVLKALGMRSGYTDSSVSSATYVIDAWTLVHWTTVYCKAGTNPCTYTIPSVAAGHVLTFSSGGYDHMKISSISTNMGDTFTLCPSSQCYNSTADGFTVDQAFLPAVSSAGAGATTLTVAWSAAPIYDPRAYIGEWAYAGASVSYDNFSSNTYAFGTCSTCALPALSLSGTNDLIIVAGGSDVTFTGVSGCWNSTFTTSGNNFASYCLGQPTYIPPSSTITEAHSDAGSVLAIRGN